MAATSHEQFPWTDDQIAKAKDWFVKEGLSAGQIGKRLGTSRGSVIGKLSRLGITRGATRGRETAAIQNRLNAAEARAPEVKRSPAEGAGLNFGTQTTTSKPLPKLRVVTTDSTPRTIFDPQFRGCRWPISGQGADTLFCCATQEPKRPYCVAHVEIAYQPLQSGKPRTGNELMRSVRRYA